MDPLSRALADAGFDGRDLKTVSVSVRPAYDNIQKDGVYRTVFAGFEYDHRLRMEMPSDNETVGRAMDAMLLESVQFSMSYHLRDSEAAERSAMSDAVRDAASKARQLAEDAGVSLGDIVSIQYGRSDESPRMFRAVATNAGGPDLVPESISFRDSVTVTWQRH